MQAIKLRLISMGSIISTLGTFLLLTRGYRPELLGVLLVGLGLLVVGLLWKGPKNADANRRDVD
jgi:hypothetical protein